jgi:hypothetical protein
VVVLPLVRAYAREHAPRMELLVLVVLLLAVNIAVLLGRGADTRDNVNWDPAGCHR